MTNKSMIALLVAAVPACAGLTLAAFPEACLPIAAAISYASCFFFVIGIQSRVLRWAITPVPFRIPTTCGQQRSLSWIRSARLDNPATGSAAAGRMVLEVVFFRSLFRNSHTRIGHDRLTVRDGLGLWLAAIVFHWSLLVVLLRHLRLFVEPVPAFVFWIEKLDAPIQAGAPSLYLSDATLLLALAYLLLRRFADPAVRYISMISDYLALWLLLGIGVTGVLMRYWIRVDVAAIKQFALGLATFSPVLPAGIGPIFFAHLFLVCTLAVYIPSGKLMHMAGVWLSPTRNLANNNRAVRHVNPWNAPVKTHTYAEWQEEYGDKLKIAGIPLEEEDAERTHSN